MRVLDFDDMQTVAGGVEACVSVSKGGTTVEGCVSGDTADFGQGLIDLYDGAVAALSHVIETVAEAVS